MFKNWGGNPPMDLSPSQDVSLKLVPKDLKDLKEIGARTFQDLKMSRPFLYREQIVKLAGIKYHGSCPLDKGFSKILEMKLITIASQKEIDDCDLIEYIRRWRKDNAQLVKEMEKNNPPNKREPDYEYLKCFLPHPPPPIKKPGPGIVGKKKIQAKLGEEIIPSKSGNCGEAFWITDAGIKKLEYYNGGINLRFSLLNIPPIEVVKDLLIPLQYFK
jgi:hypothetical protein